MRLICGDCIEEMAKLEAGSIDMVLADPPYGTTACKWDLVIPFDRMWEQINRVAKKNAAVIMTGKQPFTSYLIMSNIKNFKYCLVWNKESSSNYGNFKYMPALTHEDIIVFYRAVPIFNPIRVPRSEKSLKRDPCGVSRVKRAVKTKGVVPEHFSDRNGLKCRDTVVPADGLRHPISIIYASKNLGKEAGKHPTQKPVSLMQTLIETYTNPGDRVLDFTMGSGTTGVACRNSGRKFTGIELERKYYEIAEERINGGIL